MKTTSSEMTIVTLQWTSYFLLLAAGFVSLMGGISDWDVVTPGLTLAVGFSIGIQASRILKAQEERISELERRIG